MKAHRPTRLEIDLDALAHNFSEARRAAGEQRQVLAVVKADAYGHGAERVAPFLQKEGANLFGVATTEEAVALRLAGIERPIVIFGGIWPGQETAVITHRLSPALFDLDTLRRLNQAAAAAETRATFHLKLDTGMGRVGFRPHELAGVLRELASLQYLHMEGVISHLAVADELANPYTAEQVQRFRQSLQQVRSAGFAPEYVHISNSAALFTLDIPECNLVRPGITLYGALPSTEFAGRLNLRPTMRLTTRIAQLKTVDAGTGVSYGHRYVAGGEAVVATIPIGYADGYNRRLTNCGEVLVRGQRARVAGTVCMDWTMIDVSRIPGVQVGDEVVLLGSGNGDEISAQEWADRVGTIPYEVFCGIAKRVPRVYIGG